MTTAPRACTLQAAILKCAFSSAGQHVSTAAAWEPFTNSPRQRRLVNGAPSVTQSNPTSLPVPYPRLHRRAATAEGASPVLGGRLPKSSRP
jgi:hypothetical protein